MEEVYSQAALLGLRIEESIRREDLRQRVEALIRDAVLSLGVPFDYAEIERRIERLVSSIETSAAVPIEASPLAGQELITLSGNASFIGVAVSISMYAIAAHNPLILLVTPAGVVLMGAAVGAAEGLRSGLRDITAGFFQSLRPSQARGSQRRARRSSGKP